MPEIKSLTPDVVTNSGLKGLSDVKSAQTKASEESKTDQALDTPAYVVAVNAIAKEDGPVSYSPAELKEKARQFLSSDIASPEEAKVLQQILEGDDE